MEPQHQAPDPVSTGGAEANPLLCVTPLSKYLAMALFVILPFLGGWIGYMLADAKMMERTLAVHGTPERAGALSTASLSSEEKDGVAIGARSIESFTCTTAENPNPHSCYKLVDEDTNDVVVADLTALAREQAVLTGERTALTEIHYESTDGRTVYFRTGIPNSDACCKLVEFDTVELRFTDRSDIHAGLPRSAVSKDKRYVATAVSEETVLKITDLELGETIYEEVLSTGTLQSGTCGFFGFSTDIVFSEDDTAVTYGIYNEELAGGSDCEFELLERKTVSIK